MYVFSWKTIFMSFEPNVYYGETFQQKKRVMESVVKFNKQVLKSANSLPRHIISNIDKT